MSKSKPEKVFVPVEDRVPIKEKTTYSIGFAAKDCVSVVINSYIMVYLMTVVGLNAAFIGTMMLAARIFDAINDPLIGQFVDHRNAKKGRYRPVIRLGSIGLAITFFALMFCPDFGGIGKYVWCTVFYVGYGVCFTFVEVPYFGIIPAMTSSPHERASVTSWSRMASRVPAIVIPIAIGFLTNAFGDATGYAAIGAIVAVIVIIGGFISFGTLHEKAITNPETEKAGLKSFINVLRNNWALLIIMLVQLFFTFNTVLGDMLNVLYISYYLNRPELSSFLIAPVNAGLIIGQLLVPFYQKLIGGGKKGIIIGFVAYIVMLFACLGAGHINVPIWVVAMFLLNMVCGAMQISVIMFCFDNADVVEYRTGERADATIFAIVSFLMKLSAGMAASVAAFALGFAGFTMQGPGEGANVGMMSTIRYIVPAICVVFALICMFIYPVKDKQMVKIREALMVKHEKIREAMESGKSPEEAEEIGKAVIEELKEKEKIL